MSLAQNPVRVEHLAQSQRQDQGTRVSGPITSGTSYLTILSFVHSGLQPQWPLDIPGTFQALSSFKAFVIAASSPRTLSS